MKRGQARGVRAALALSVVILAAAPARAACDLLGPVLTSASLSTNAVNVIAGPATVRCTMSISDDLSGVADATCSVQAPVVPPQIPQTESCSADVPSSGTPLNGTWQCDITIPRYSQSGMWTLSSATASDAVGNFGSGFFPPAMLSVTSTPDTVSPALTTFDFNPKSVDVTSQNRTLTCSMGISDALSGVAFAVCSFASPLLPSLERHAAACIATAPSAGTRNSGTFTCTATVPRYAQSGAWKASVQLWDDIGNFTILSDADLLGRGLPETLTVTSAPDINAPTLVNFTFAPTSVDPQGGPQTVSCTMQLTDALAGVASATCSFASPIFGQVHSCAATTPSSGTPNNGTYTCAVTIPRYSEGGLWSATMGASDAVGNEMQFQSPTPLNVACDATGGGEADIRFQPDEQTLVWDAVTGAVSYNHYRGAVSSLTDLDFDGLADSGYGECRNSTDPDTTDTQFVDATVPGARTGLFYLVAWVDGVGAEQGLGRSSTGLDRFPTVPCP